MRPFRKAIGVLFPLLLIGGFALVGAVWGEPEDGSGDDRSFSLEDIQVEAAVKRNGVMLVREEVTYDFNGTFNVGTRDFDSGPWEIRNIRAFEGNRRLGEITNTPTLYEWDISPASGTHTYELRYEVHNAVLAWPDVAELNWQWVGRNVPEPVGRHRVTLRVPGDGEGVRAWAHGPLSGTVVVDGRTVRTDVEDLPEFTFLETRVIAPRSRFGPDLPEGREGLTEPRDYVTECDFYRAALERDGTLNQRQIDRLIADYPACQSLTPVETEPQQERIIAEETALAEQANEDRAEFAREQEEREDRRRALNLAAPFVIGGALLAAWLVWRKWGKEPDLTTEIDYWREVPDDPPAVAIALREWGLVDTDAFSTTVVDLAQRGYLTIQEDGKDHKFLKTDKSVDGLLEFERNVMSKLFEDGPTNSQKELTGWAKGNRREAASWLSTFKNSVVKTYEAKGYQVKGQVAGWLLYLLIVGLLGLYAWAAIAYDAFAAGARPSAPGCCCSASSCCCAGERRPAPSATRSGKACGSSSRTSPSSRTHRRGTWPCTSATSSPRWPSAWPTSSSRRSRCASRRWPTTRPSPTGTSAAGSASASGPSPRWATSARGCRARPRPRSGRRRRRARRAVASAAASPAEAVAAEAVAASAPADPTVAVYEARAREWARERRAAHPERAGALAELTGPVVDLGCGPGWHLPHLGPRAIALDAARAMLDLVPERAPAPRVQARLEALPFRRGGLGGAWASKSYVHLARPAVPLALADLHRSLAVGAPADLTVFGGDADEQEYPDDEFAGRTFSFWPEDLLRGVFLGAGFSIDDLTVEPARDGLPHLLARVRRERTLADTVGPGMRLLVCGLNPSVYSADVGHGFARPGNRFWPAALAAGLVTRGHDPRHALAHHGIGMTDLVKRATPRADALTADEYDAGVARVRRLVEWLRPEAVVMVGLAGWRVAVDRKAVAGVQPDPFGGRPLYLMPSTSGLNAHSRLADLVTHLQAAATL